MKSKVLLALLVVSLVLSLVAACAQPSPSPTASPSPSPKPSPSPSPSSSPAAAKIPILIGTGPSTWTTYAISVGVADILNRSTNVNITVKSLAGEPAIVQAAGEGGVDLSFGSTQRVLGQLFDGTSIFKDKAPNKKLRAVLTYQVMNFGIMTPAKSNIKTVADLKGKKVARFTAVLMDNVYGILEAYGLNLEKDINWVTLPGQVEARKEVNLGRLDAWWDDVTTGDADTTEVYQAVGKLYSLPVEPDKYAKAVQLYPAAFNGTQLIPIKADYADFLTTLPGQNLVGVLFTQGTNTGVSSDLVYTYVKGWFAKDNIEKIQKVHPTIAEYMDKVALPSYIPFHDGAVKALKEVGKWTPEMEKAQQDALARAK